MVEKNAGPRTVWCRRSGLSCVGESRRLPGGLLALSIIRAHHVPPVLFLVFVWIFAVMLCFSVCFFFSTDLMIRAATRDWHTFAESNLRISTPFFYPYNSGPACHLPPNTQMEPPDPHPPPPPPVVPQLMLKNALEVIAVAGKWSGPLPTNGNPVLYDDNDHMRSLALLEHCCLKYGWRTDGSLWSWDVLVDELHNNISNPGRKGCLLREVFRVLNIPPFDEGMKRFIWEGLLLQEVSNDHSLQGGHWMAWTVDPLLPVFFQPFFIPIIHFFLFLSYPQRAILSSWRILLVLPQARATRNPPKWHLSLPRCLNLHLRLAPPSDLTSSPITVPDPSLISMASL